MQPPSHPMSMARGYDSYFRVGGLAKKRKGVCVWGGGGGQLEVSSIFDRNFCVNVLHTIEETRPEN